MAGNPVQVQKRDGLFVDIERATVKEPAQKNPASTYRSAGNLDAVKILFETLHNPLLGVYTAGKRTVG